MTLEFGEYTRTLQVKAIRITEANAADVAEWLISQGLSHMVGPEIPLDKWLVEENDGAFRTMFIRDQSFVKFYQQKGDAVQGQASMAM